MTDSLVLFAYWLLWAASQHPHAMAFLWTRVRMILKF